ncbi:Alcohol dehydrogenase transcription factor Myb/SANT-like [Popillia japonica]|uniref:Alcohol dehydrogenase transcription factor Myb/SANT-like n=1 Tax=Popillia japonica TaxID=7064 RepID=A0AAW1MZN7_POPJA
MPRIAKTEIDTIRLIAEVQKQPVLWDPSYEQNPQNVTRKRAWRTVCGILYNNFYSMDVTNQRKLVKEIKTRWLGVRKKHRQRYELSKRLPIRVNKRESAKTACDSLDFLLPTYSYANNGYRFKTDLEKYRENNDPPSKQYLVIEVKDELSQNVSSKTTHEIKNEAIDDAQTEIPIKTETFNDTEVVVNDTSQDATINSTVHDINCAATKTPINKEVFDNDLDINETVIKQEIIDDVKVDTSDTLNDNRKCETFTSQHNNQSHDNDAFFALLQSRVKKLSHTQQLKFRIEALNLLTRIKSRSSNM